MSSAAPISGGLVKAEVSFDFEIDLMRLRESPPANKPYTDVQWEDIQELGEIVDRHLKDGDVRPKMGGGSTFVSVDDMEDS